MRSTVPCGDVNLSGEINVGDVVSLIDYLFHAPSYIKTISNECRRCQLLAGH